MSEKIFELVVTPVIVGIFSVMGGVIPLISILFIVFCLVRHSFQKLIDSEPARIEKIKDMLTKQKEMLNKFENGVKSKEIKMTSDITEAMTSLQQSIYENEMEILLKENWVSRIKKASFLNWVTYYFAKNYFADYFKK